MNTAKPIKIHTKWANTIDYESPLNEYPRPQLQRDNWQSLNGTWKYAITETGTAAPDPMDGKITVPYAVETSLSGVCRPFLPKETLHYKRVFIVENYKSGHRVILHFEAVDWQCDVLVNNQLAGSHTGGYIPFSFDITDLINEGSNELHVSVTDPTDSNWQQRGKQVLEPKVIWYTATSGIWQPVWIEVVPKNHIQSLKITPNLTTDSVSIVVKSVEDTDVSIEISAGENSLSTNEASSNSPIELTIPDIRVWSPDDPFLYGLKVTLIENRKPLDEVISYFGMRSISLKEGPALRNQVMLNSKAIFLNGPLDQGYWPESGMTPPCDEAAIFDLESMKNLGFNMIRKHIKVESRRWYYHADRLGLLVIQDMPNGGKGMASHFQTMKTIAFGTSSPDNNDKAYNLANRQPADSRTNYETELYDMLNHLHNAPSIIIWCPFNEAWGQFDAKRIYTKIKQADPSRLVDHASGWYDQKSGDFRSIHTYKIKLKTPPKKDKRAYLISEYGGYNYIDKTHLWRDDDVYGYKYFETLDALTDAYENLIINQVIPLIEKGLCGVVYTQLSDVEIESNGFYTYDRKVLKFNAEKIRELHNLLYEKFNSFHK